VKMGNGEHWDRSANLFGSWTDFAHKAGDTPGTIKTFANNMVRRGFEKYRVPKDGKAAYRFVRLLAGQQ
jgi:putative DNA primase/helicase